ncbi:hypothetical protein GCM10010399_00130 [Dactylosporangium fulvum]|uniref:DUF6153 family protein n=1 Tax=Dactylosporangium fulvum TaxID=53359 RepID=A0ABY5VR85_9ACTN|nr:DUF6153 family protein [Dactylosporangium fulvum]UWP79581.1 DUF6153 family protein [Dactylosporangium fulvum]
MMVVMARFATRHAGGHAARWFAVIAVLLALAVGWMHTAAVAPPHPGPHAQPHRDVTSVAVSERTGAWIVAATRDGEHCGAATGHAGGDCPGGDHARSMCQAPPPGGPVLGSPPPQPSGAVPADVTAALPATTAAEAAGGSGCGPPSLAMLSVLRT